MSSEKDWKADRLLGCAHRLFGDLPPVTGSLPCRMLSPPSPESLAVRLSHGPLVGQGLRRPMLDASCAQLPSAPQETSVPPFSRQALRALATHSVSCPSFHHRGTSQLFSACRFVGCKLDPSPLCHSNCGGNI